MCVVTHSELVSCSRPALLHTLGIENNNASDYVCMCGDVYLLVGIVVHFIMLSM